MNSGEVAMQQPEAGSGEALQQRAPGYWRCETSGKLEPVVRSYLEGGELDEAGLGIMRAYLVQWFDASVWDASPELESLRAQARVIASTHDVTAVIEYALEVGLDPL